MATVTTRYKVRNGTENTEGLPRICTEREDNDEIFNRTAGQEQRDLDASYRQSLKNKK